MEMTESMQRRTWARHNRLVISAMIFLLLFSICQANKATKWIEADGEGKTQEEALQCARNNAARSAVGTRALTSLSIFESSSSDSDEALKVRQRSTFTLTSGLVVKEEILKGELRTKGEGLSAEPYYWVRINAEVLDLGEPDPAFQVELALEPLRESYYHGQNVVIQVSANDTCYVTILTLSARNEVYLLLPNWEERDVSLIPGRPIRFEGIMMCQPNLSVVPEQLVVVATRGKWGFVSPDELNNWTLSPTESGAGYLATNLVGTLERFAEWLVQMPADTWTLARVQYQIRR